MKITKVEHHCVDYYYTYELDEDKLAEIYPDLDPTEIGLLALELYTGTKSISDVMDDAFYANVEIEWDFDGEDNWTDRKGGYEVDYDVVEEDEGE